MHKIVYISILRVYVLMCLTNVLLSALICRHYCQIFRLLVRTVGSLVMTSYSLTPCLVDCCLAIMFLCRARHPHEGITRSASTQKKRMFLLFFVHGLPNMI